MSSPRTHIYTYLVPLFVFAAIGFRKFCPLDDAGPFSARKGMALSLFVGMVSLSFLVTNTLFVDHDPEYPYSAKRVLGIGLEGGKIEGAMAFPYSRNWQEVASFLSTVEGGRNARYVTNEKRSIVDFYLRGVMKPMSRQERELPESIYLIMVEKPMSWIGEVSGREPDYYRERYPVVFRGEGNAPEIVRVDREPGKG